MGKKWGEVRVGASSVRGVAEGEATGSLVSGQDGRRVSGYWLCQLREVGCIGEYSLAVRAGSLSSWPTLVVLGYRANLRLGFSTSLSLGHSCCLNFRASLVMGERIHA